MMRQIWLMNGKRKMETNKLKYLLKLILLINLAYETHAVGLERCFSYASIKYKIPAKLLKAIAKTETKFKPLAIHMNKNQTYDVGLMQINSSWLTKLNKVGITQADLLNGCKNIQVGAWILASNIKQYGFSSKAIGAYNSPTEINQEQYARKVLGNL